MLQGKASVATLVRIHRLSEMISPCLVLSSSLFECFLTRKEFILLQAKLTEHLDRTQDSVRFYPLCASCVSKVETVGGPPPADDLLFLV